MFVRLVRGLLASTNTLTAEDAGVENAGAYHMGGKCRSDKVWKAIRKNTLKHQTKYGSRG